MTEKEAIEKLHNEKKIDLITLIRKFKKEGIENFVVTRQEIIETVLKALEQKDKEIAELRIKQISSNLNNSIKQKQKEDEQLQALNEGWKIELEKKDKEIPELKEKYDKDTHILQNQLDLANADRIEKDKIINEMAEHIVSSAIVDDTVCAIKCDCDINEDCSYEKMLKCTKQYFEKKVRDKYV